MLHGILRYCYHVSNTNMFRDNIKVKLSFLLSEESAKLRAFLTQRFDLVFFRGFLVKTSSKCLINT